MKKGKQSVVNIGVIGHVDHGKTSLVKALTGKWADTHSEELKKGISIRLGYADATFYKCEGVKGAEAYNSTGDCGSGGVAKELRRVSFIDAPGHETLMATMLSGTALMNGAILVIAANEKCPQPSTEEHLMALSISGIKNLVVVQNKIDLVDKKRALESFNEIKSFLKAYGYEGAPIIPVSANFGVNLDLLIEAIEKTIPTPKNSGSKDLRMLVVRSFDINKPGTRVKDFKGGVLGGSILRGTLKVGDEIEIKPGINNEPVVTEVVSLGVEGGFLEEAKPGGLIAVGTKLDPFFTKNDEMRGQVVARPGELPDAVTSLSLEVTIINRISSKMSVEFKENDFVVLAVGTATVVGQVVKKLGNNKFEFRTRTPIIVEENQKVAISKRQQSGWRLCAYGVLT